MSELPPDLSLLRHNRTSKFLYLDFETYNLCLHRDFNAPWQAGLMMVQNNQVIDTKEILFNWKGKYEMSADNPSAKHYSERKIQEQGVRPVDGFNSILKEIEKCDYLVGHNFLKFDIFILKELFALFSIKDYKSYIPKIIDTKCLALAIALNCNKSINEPLTDFQFRFLNFFRKGLKTNLSFLSKEYGIEVKEEETHSAINDLKINIQIFNKQKYQLDI